MEGEGCVNQVGIYDEPGASLATGCYLGTPGNGYLFREGKSTESKCNKTVVDHITQIPIEYHIHTMIISEYK